MNEVRKIENALEASTAKDNLLDILGGASDYTIEHLLSLGESIPIVSYLTKGIKTAISVRDYLFMEKVVEFLRTVAEEPTKERLKMVNDIQNDPKYSEKFGKVSMVALERYDEPEKAKLLGYAAKYLARNEITFSLYKRVSFIIGRLYLPDLMAFVNHTKSMIFLNSTTDLEALSLVKTDWGLTKGSGGDTPDVGWSVKVTDLGKLIKCIVLQTQLNVVIPSGVNATETFIERMKNRYP